MQNKQVSKGLICKEIADFANKLTKYAIFFTFHASMRTEPASRDAGSKKTKLNTE